MTSRRRLTPKPIKNLCVECGREKRDPARTDGLGVSCAKYKVEMQEKVANFKAARDKKK
jgi:hypothetical protein